MGKHGGMWIDRWHDRASRECLETRRHLQDINVWLNSMYLSLFSSWSCGSVRDVDMIQEGSWASSSEVDRFSVLV